MSSFGDGILDAAAHRADARRTQAGRDVDERAADRRQSVDDGRDEDAVDADVGAALEHLDESRAVDGRIGGHDDEHRGLPREGRLLGGAPDIGAVAHRVPVVVERQARGGCRLRPAHHELLEP
jgi:hypothetical protein